MFQYCFYEHAYIFRSLFLPQVEMFCMILQGGGGMIPLPKGYLKAAFELIRENGGVCISDEVSSDTYLTYLIYLTV